MPYYEAAIDGSSDILSALTDPSLTKMFENNNHPDKIENVFRLS
jgi:hypothetical protein